MFKKGICQLLTKVCAQELVKADWLDMTLTVLIVL